MLFTKDFNSFTDGIQELAEVSFSAKQALEWQTGFLPETEREAVSSLALNAAFDRPTGNGVGWGEVAIEISAFGVEYRTRSGLRFGWKTLLGASDFDSFEGEYTFYIAHPDATEESAAPLGSTLRQSAEKHGWREKSEFMLELG